MVVSPTAVDSRVAIEGCDSRASEEGGADVADQTAHAVDGKDIESIVDTEEELDLGGIVGAGSTEDTKDDSSPRRNVAWEMLAGFLRMCPSVWWNIPEPGVMQTNPATTPEQKPTVENFLSRR